MDLPQDLRFAHIKNDPKFKRIPKKERKVIIDDRFKSMFNDKKFKDNSVSIDKRGSKRINKSDDLKKYYDLSCSESEQSDDADDDDKEEEKDEKKSNKKVSKASKKHEESEDVFEKSENSDLEDEKIRKKLKDSKIDYARGEGTLYSDDSSDDETSEDDEDEEEELDHKWGELDKEAGTTDEVSSRLAICNMDWDRIRAVDLMVLINSFLPPGGLIKSITIYPSEFGIERMKEEEIKGPIELIDNLNKNKKMEDNFNDDESNENEEGSEYHMEKMRQYQLNRLKYYYAVAVFDSATTANKVYTECDGIEYESTATKMDLRFIPDDMEFDQEPKEVCDKLPLLNKYTPRLFTTTALQQAKVELTWDETEVERKEITEKLNSGKIDEISEVDIHAYLASGSSDDDEDDNENDLNKENPEDDNCESDSDQIDKYKALLKSVEEKEAEKQNKDVELEFTWGIGMKEKVEKDVEKSLKEKMELTPLEKYKEKLKEKKKQKREKSKLKKKGIESDEENISSSDDEENDKRQAELELLLAEEDDKSHFDMKKIEKNESLSTNKKKLKKQKKELIKDDFQVDVNDERFSAVYFSNEYNIDPADPHFRKTKGTEALIKEKFKRRANNDDDNTPKAAKQMKNDNNKVTGNLEALIKSVKRKTKNFQ